MVALVHLVPLLLLSAGSASNQTTHIALGSEARSMQVTWSLAPQKDVPTAQEAFVAYGVGSSLTTNVTATSQVLANNDVNSMRPAMGSWRNITVYHGDAQTSITRKLALTPPTPVSLASRLAPVNDLKRFCHRLQSVRNTLISSPRRMKCINSHTWRPITRKDRPTLRSSAISA
jgi:hypothetical protein